MARWRTNYEMFHRDAETRHLNSQRWQHNSPTSTFFFDFLLRLSSPTLVLRIQMMFQVYGSKEQALVTVEAVKTRGTTRFNLLALDVLNR
jgi:hypothetical protein